MRRIAGALAALGVAASSPASAAIIAGTYYEDTAALDCLSMTTCVAIFNLPAELSGQFLVVNSVGCLGTTMGSLNSGQLSISDNGQNVRRTYPLALTGVKAGSNFSFKEQVQYKVSGGPPRRVSLQVSATAGITNFLCTLVGTITPQ